MSHTVFHLGLSTEQLKQATLAIIPVAPERVEKIAQSLDQPEFLVSNREYTVYLGKLQGQSVVICSTGIGGPSTSIAVEELAQLGIKSFLRVGTTGAIQPDILVGDIIITTGSVRLDGASLHFAPIAFPAVADFNVAMAMKKAAQKLGVTVHTGITASSDTFYPGQERYDTFSGHVISHLQGSLKQWQQLGVLNFEMESATLFTMCSSLGLKAGCVAGVIINRTEKEQPNHKDLNRIEQKSIDVVIETAKALLSS